MNQPNRTLYESDRYFIILTDKYQRDDENDGPYQVINKDTGVNEFGSRAYAACLEMCLKMELVIDSMLEQFEAHKASKMAPKLEVAKQESLDPRRNEVLSYLEKARANPKPVDLNVYRQLDLDLPEDES